uniref:Uncharacterized protein n=1 Tax=Romanomermis culicivorax TaxID=13658 RepID=A0A915JNN7_ROMCU
MNVHNENKLESNQWISARSTGEIFEFLCSKMLENECSRQLFLDRGSKFTVLERLGRKAAITICIVFKMSPIEEAELPLREQQLCDSE